jgi:hypothetical protein
VVAIAVVLSSGGEAVVLSSGGEVVVLSAGGEVAVPTVVEAVVDTVAVSSLYTLRRFGPPQYSVELSLQVIAQSAMGAETAPSPKESPHQHYNTKLANLSLKPVLFKLLTSPPYSTPA